MTRSITFTTIKYDRDSGHGVFIELASKDGLIGKFSLDPIEAKAVGGLLVKEAARALADKIFNKLDTDHTVQEDFEKGYGPWV